LPSQPYGQKAWYPGIGQLRRKKLHAPWVFGRATSHTSSKKECLLMLFFKRRFSFTGALAFFMIEDKIIVGESWQHKDIIEFFPSAWTIV